MVYYLSVRVSPDGRTIANFVRNGSISCWSPSNVDMETTDGGAENKDYARDTRR